MKHISPNLVAADMPVRAPTRRALAKQQTRLKVLAAARKLFSEEGYEGATIRDIAAAAGMSTGAVFANFSDKSDLFREIMSDDMEVLNTAMRDAATRGRNVEAHPDPLLVQDLQRALGAVRGRDSYSTEANTEENFDASSGAESHASPVCCKGDASSRLEVFEHRVLHLEQRLEQQEPDGVTTAL